MSRRRYKPQLENYLTRLEREQQNVQSLLDALEEHEQEYGKANFIERMFDDKLNSRICKVAFIFAGAVALFQVLRYMGVININF